MTSCVRLKGVQALTLKDVQSNSDEVIVKEVIVDLQALTGKQFTRDTCCDGSDANAHCEFAPALLCPEM